MEFKKIYLNGFKSFAEKTNFLIEDGLTGIVGPNGCGKSNIVEAIKWNMGEAGPSRLRAGEMNDLIFSGTKGRASRNSAEVVVTIKNNDNSMQSFENDDEIEVVEESKISICEIDVIAATVTPGLVGCLRVGSITARSLCALHSKPFMGIHHLEGHLSSILFSKNSPITTFLTLLVSGGHTELIKVDDRREMQRLGRSYDDAAGEAFDKVGRLLGLGYPGGPAIAKIAKEGYAS